MEELRWIEHHLIEEKEDGEKYFFNNNFTEAALKLLSWMNIDLIINDIVYYHMSSK